MALHAVVIGTIGAEPRISQQAVCAVPAAAAHEAYADSISSSSSLMGFAREGEGACLHFHVLHISPDFFDDADAFVAEDNVIVREVLICAAETGELVFEEDFVGAGPISGDLSFDDTAGFGPFEGRIFDLGGEGAHSGRLSWLRVDI